MDRNLDDMSDDEHNRVALRKESVDRNILARVALLHPVLSLSARRAWIEIPQKGGGLKTAARRSPQGERG